MSLYKEGWYSESNGRKSNKKKKIERSTLNKMRNVQVRSKGEIRVESCIYLDLFQYLR